MTTKSLEKRSGARVSPKSPGPKPVSLPTQICEEDRTNKFRLTDKSGKTLQTYLGAQLFDICQSLQSEPPAFLQTIQKQFEEELSQIVQLIGAWAKEREDRIAGCEFGPSEGAMQKYCRFQFIVTQKGTTYDKSLAADLSQLGIKIATKLNCKILRVDVLMVPEAPKNKKSASA